MLGKLRRNNQFRLSRVTHYRAFLYHARPLLKEHWTITERTIRVNTFELLDKSILKGSVDKRINHKNRLLGK
jgi:hypothetical protein